MLAIAMVAVGAPIPLFALVGWAGPAIARAATFGAGSLVFNVVFDTHLQRTLDLAAFARAYGLVLPAAVAGIVTGALLALPCQALLGLDGTLALFGALALACAPLVLGRSARRSGNRREKLPRRPDLRVGRQAGSMFWLRWKTLSGS